MNLNLKMHFRVISLKSCRRLLPCKPQLIGFLLLVAFCNTNGQGTLEMVKGTITDGQNNPLLGATVNVKGESKSVVTNNNGMFQINAAKNGALVISFIGYETQTVAIKGRSVIDITMAASSAKGLNEVVVIGYGTQKKKDLTGAVTHVDATKYAQFPNVSLMQSLHGSVAGLNVGAVDQPGEDPSLTIRGQNTLSSSSSANAPLIVVDGIIYRNSISDLNTADIESVDILKDASASAIYGSQASNGVILITTKRGNQTGKPLIDYSFKYSLQDPSNKLKPFNTQEDGKFITNVLWLQSRVASDYLTPNPNFDLTPYLKTLDLSEGYKNGTDNDWWGLLTGNGHIQQHNLSISGKNEMLNYFVSGGLTNQTGFVENQNYKRYNVRANLNAKINDWLSVGFESFLTSSDYSGVAPTVSELFHLQSFASIYDTSGQYSLTPDGLDLNPFLQIKIKDLNKKMNLFGNFHTDIKLPFLKGLNYRLNYSNNYINANHDQFNPWGLIIREVVTKTPV